MTLRKRVAFALIAMVLALGLPGAAILAADVYLHNRVQKSAGVNRWGYRGFPVSRKRRGEHRLVVLGGSTAFGYGVRSDEAFPAQLEADLRPAAKNGAPVSVVNLGWNNTGAYCFRFVLEDYASLDYDAVILYEGYNDLGDKPNVYPGRRESPIFRLTGYYPIFPVAFKEKAMALRFGGDIEAGYRDAKTVFRPGLASRTTAGALDAAARIGESLDEQLGRFAKASAIRGPGVVVTVSSVGCPPRWAHYCGAVYDGIQTALAHGKKVLVVTQPYLHVPHPEQQAALRPMLAARFGGNRNVRYVNLGSLIDPQASDLSFDRMHLTAVGNAIIASHLVEPIVELMPDAFNLPATPVSAPGRSDR